MLVQAILFNGQECSKKLNNNWGSAEENSLWDFPQAGKQNNKSVEGLKIGKFVGFYGKSLGKSTCSPLHHYTTGRALGNTSEALSSVKQIFALK